MKKNKKFKRRISMLLSLTMMMGLIQVPYHVQAEEPADNVEAVMEEYEILPSPHSISYEDEYTVYNSLINVVCSETSIDTVTNDYIKEIFGSENVTFAETADDEKTNLYLSRDDMDDQVETWMRDIYGDVIDDAVLEKNESHIIIADENGISVIGNDDVGLFQGLTTIKFILSQIEENEKGYRHFVINDYADMPFRGLIEGYYGEPWSWADRADLLKFGSGFKMNKIVFAPKNDPYHYEKWDELYPDQSADAENNIQNVEIAASMGRKYKVDFVWTAHCFIKGDAGIRYTAGDENVAGSHINKLIAKFEQLYDAGVRSFGLLLDDIEYGPRTLAGGHYNKDEALTDEVLAETTAIVNIMADWCTEKGDCDDLIFCPAGFVTEWMKNGFSMFFTQAHPYQELSYYDIHFRDNVHIMTTGNGVFSDTDQSVADLFKRAYINEQNGYEAGAERRSPLMWTNYPTVDASPELDMGPIENFRTNLNPEDMNGLLSNPLQWAHINKTVIPMVTQYTWNLKDYDATEVYNASMKYIAGSEELGEALRIFSNHNSTRGSEGEGTEELKAAINAFKADYNEVTANTVLEEINKVVDACEKLLVEEDHVDAGLYRQVKPYANALRDLAKSIQSYMHIFTPEKNPMNMLKDAKAFYSSHTGYSIGTWGKYAVVGTRLLVPFAQWLDSNGTRLIAASNHEGFELEMLIAELEVMDFTWHEESSVATLQNVLEEVKAVAEKADATEEERAQALAKLQAARDALEFVLEGSGTQEDPYLISSEADLMTLSTIVNNSEAFAAASYKMTEDIFMTESAFVPIGQEITFKGTFDGDGHTISNLMINQETKSNVGLFGFVEGGTIKNVGIRSGNIHGSAKVGAVAGRTMYATILNCYSKAKVTAVTNDCGGVVGMLNNSTMKNCFSWGTVQGGGESIGGLVGAANRSIDLAATSTIENCYSVAKVSGTRYAGTLIGYDESAAGEQYFITYKDLYYVAGETGIGNNTRAEAIALSNDSFVNGELLEKLNASLTEEGCTWLAGVTGYPEFKLEALEEIDTAALEALLAEVEVMDLSSYSAATVAALNAAVSEAKDLMSSIAATQRDIDTAIESIRNAVNNLTEAPYFTVSTNMPQYDVYSITNVCDGNNSTIFWKAGVQAVGDYILFTYQDVISVNSVRLISSPNSDMLEGADVQVSTDGVNWTTVGSFTRQDDQTAEFDAVNAKYVRIYLTQGTATWLKVNEVIINNVVFADKTELEALVAEVEALDLSIYTDDTVGLLTTTLDQAKAVLANDSATQEDVESAIAYLRMRKDNLVEKPVEPEIPETEVCKVFADVEHGAWYEGSVQYVYDEGIIVGDGNVFAPNDATTRAMVAVILYRLAGSPKVTEADYVEYNKFTDLPKEHLWYSDAVAWALKEKVSTGDDVNMRYNPTSAVTREQLALFLYRYAEYTGKDVTVTEAYDELFGETYVADWAKEGFAWAIENGIIKGAEAMDDAGNTYYDLNPQGTATRAQFARVLHRYVGGAVD